MDTDNGMDKKAVETVNASDGSMTSSAILESLPASKDSEKQQKENAIPTTIVEDAKGLIVQFNNPFLFTRCEFDKWILHHLMRPIDLAAYKNNDIEILEFSSLPHPLWSKPSRKQSTSARKDRPASSSSRIQKPSSSTDSASTSQTRLQITPYTKIFTIAKAYKIVFVLDVSSSISTVDVDRFGNVICTELFETLCKCLDGISRPFDLETSLREKPIRIKPKLYITVIAHGENGTTIYTDGKNKQSLPDYRSEYPVRVLLQDHTLTRANLETTLTKLYEEVIHYENDIISHFQQTRVPHKYHPDSSTQNLADEEAPLSPPATPTEPSSSSFSPSTTPPVNTTTQYCLTSLLEYGLFNLGHPPTESFPTVIVLTDGVSGPKDASAFSSSQTVPRTTTTSTSGPSSSNSSSSPPPPPDSASANSSATPPSSSSIPSSSARLSQIVRQFTGGGGLVVFQLGSGDGYSPICNYGHVPDHEIVRYLAWSTGGKFLYAKDCPYLEDEEGEEFVGEQGNRGEGEEENEETDADLEDMEHSFVDTTRYRNLAAKQHLKRKVRVVGEPLKSSSSSFSSPASTSTSLPLCPLNFYHRFVLMREINLSRIHTESNFRVVVGGKLRPVDMVRTRLMNSFVAQQQQILLQQQQEQRQPLPQQHLQQQQQQQHQSQQRPQEQSATGASSNSLLMNDQIGFSDELLISKYPWERHSKAPPIPEILCGYKEYAMNISMDYLLSARFLEGFVLHTISWNKKPAKKDRLEIILAYPWLPHVTILYTLKTHWSSHSSNRPLLGTRVVKTQKVEITILAHEAFGFLFVNFQSIGEDSLGNSKYLLDLYSKVRKLHEYLKSLHEMDDFLKVVASFNSKYALSALPPSVLLRSSSSTRTSASELATSRSSMTTPPPMNLNGNSGSNGSIGNTNTSNNPTSTMRTPSNDNNYWYILEKIITSHPESFDEFSCNIILRSTTTTSHSVTYQQQQQQQQSQIINSASTAPVGKSSKSESRARSANSSTTTSAASSPASVTPAQSTTISPISSPMNEILRGKRGVATIYLSRYLSEWCSFVVSRNAFFKLVYETNSLNGKSPLDGNRDSSVSSKRSEGAEKNVQEKGSSEREKEDIRETREQQIEVEEGGEPDTEIPPTGFVLLRTVWENECIVQLKLSFVGVEIEARREIVRNLVAGIMAIEHSSRSLGTQFTPLVISRKPLADLMVRYQSLETVASSVSNRSASRPFNGRQKGSLKNRFDANLGSSSPIADSKSPDPTLSTAATKPGSSMESLFRLNKLIDQHFLSSRIAKSYLRHHRWLWFADIAVDLLNDHEPQRSPIYELAFQLIYQSRLEDGFLLISESPGSLTFYKELSFDLSPTGSSHELNVKNGNDVELHLSGMGVCSIQFVLIKDYENMNVVTELWVEPVVDAALRKFYRRISDELFVKDVALMSRLFTFDRAHNLGRKGGIEDSENAPGGNQVRNMEIMNALSSVLVHRGFSVVPSLFDLPSVLRDSDFLTTAYRVPYVYADDDEYEKDLEVEATSANKKKGEDGGNFEDSNGQGVLTVQGKDAQSELSLAVPAFDDAFWISKYTTVLPVVRLLVEYDDAVDRGNLILHHFWEKAVAFFTDAEISIEHEKSAVGHSVMNKLERTDALAAIEKGLKTEMVFGDAFLVGNLESNRCFVKIRDQSSIILVFVPSYPKFLAMRSLKCNLVKHNEYRHDTEDSGEENEGDENDSLEMSYFTLTIFECERPQLMPFSIQGKPYEKALMSREPYRSQRRDETEREEPRANRFDILMDDQFDIGDEKRVLCGTFANSVMESSTPRASLSSSPLPSSTPLVNDFSDENDNLSQYARQYLNALSATYSTAFVKNVYASLLEGRIVDVRDFDRAVSSCSEISRDIDITSFLNACCLTMGGDEDMLSVEEEIQDRFFDILGMNFEPVSHLVSEERNIFFFNRLNSTVTPKELKRQGKIDELINLLENIVKHSDNPLFISVECSFEKSADLQIRFPVSSLPCSYTIPENVQDARAREFRKMRLVPSIGNEVSPLASADGTRAWLHIVCLVLPDLKAEYEHLFGAKEEDDVTHEGMDGASKSEEHTGLHFGGTRSVASLSSFKQRALQDTEARIEWLLCEEQMHRLLSLKPVNLPLLKMVQSMLQRSTSEPSSSNEIPPVSTISLRFLQEDVGQTLFLNEFGKMAVPPYTINRVDDYFYVSEEIVLGYDDTDEDEDENEDVQSDEEDVLGEKSVVQTQNFWLILSLDGPKIQLYFYSKLVSEGGRAEIMRKIRQAISDTCERVNRLILLAELNESHIASKYLIPPLEGDQHEVSDDEEFELPAQALISSSSGTTPTESLMPSVRPRKIESGSFSCPLVHKTSLHLHWRLKPQQALNNVGMALAPLAITNRRNMFVFATSASVYYMRLSEEEVPSLYADSIPSVSPLPIDGSSVDISESMAISKTNMSTRSGLERVLTLEVFGVDPPGKEVTEDFVMMLEAKLNGILLGIIQTILSRNTKLTNADVEFLLPTHKSPTKSHSFRLPRFIEDPYAFLLFLKQNLYQISQQNLNPLMGPDVSSTVRRYHERKFVVKTLVADEKGMLSVCAEDFVFYYNFIASKTPNSFEATVGQGIACLLVALVDSEGELVTEVPGNIDLTDLHNIDKIIDELETSGGMADSETDSPAASRFKLVVESWVQGSINVNALYDRLRQSFHDTVCDYVHEALISRLNTRLTVGDVVDVESTQENSDVEAEDYVLGEPISEFLASSSRVLKKSCNCKNPAVQELSMRVKFPPWMIEDFAAEVSDVLANVNKDFAPVAFRKSNCGNTSPTSVVYNSYRPQRRWNELSPTFVPAKLAHEKECLVVICGLREVMLEHGISRAPGLSLDRKASITSEGSQQGRKTSVAADDSSMSDTSSLILPSATSYRRGSSKPFTDRFIGKPVADEIAHYQNTPLVTEPNLRNSYIVLFIENSAITVFAYNIKQSAWEQFSGCVHKMLSWHLARMHFLDNILMQKMGLFHHLSDTMPRAAPISDVIGATTLAPSTGLSQIAVSSKSMLSVVSPVAGPVSPSQIAPVPSMTLDERLPVELTDMDRLVRQPFPIRKTHSGGVDPSARFDDTAASQMKLDGPSLVRSGKFSNEENSKITKGQFWNDVLRYPAMGYASKSASVSADNLEHRVDADILQRHGIEFLDAYTRNSKTGKKQKETTRAFDKWNDLRDEHTFAVNIPESSSTNLAASFSATDLADVLRKTRLFHFCRTPLLFTDLRERLFLTSGDNFIITYSDAIGYDGQFSDQQAAMDEQVIQWYKSLISSYLDEYVKYLESLGMELVLDSNFSLGHAAMPHFTISQKLSVESSVMYLQKTFDGGILLAQIGIDGMFICVNLYILSTSGEEASLFIRPSTKMIVGSNESFIMDTARFKNLIHVNSFTYDFHLRQLQKVLEEKQFLSTPIDVLSILKAFVRYTPVKANFARNRIYEGICNLEGSEYGSNLIEYIFKNPAQYGFEAIPFKGSVNSCYLLSKSPDFSVNNDLHDSRHIFSVLIFPAENTSSHPSNTLSISYFIMITDSSQIFPYLTNKIETDVYDPLKEHITEHFLLGDIAKFAEKRIMHLVEQATRYYDRDSVWRQLLTGGQQLYDPRLSSDWITIFLEKIASNSRPIFQFEQDLYNLFMNKDIPWEKVMSFLGDFFAPYSRAFEYGSVKHLILFNPYNHDFLIHFELGMNLLDVSVVSREGLAHKTERKHVSEVVNAISFWLYLNA